MDWDKAAKIGEVIMGVALAIMMVFQIIEFWESHKKKKRKRRKKNESANS